MTVYQYGKKMNCNYYGEDKVEENLQISDIEGQGREEVMDVVCQFRIYISSELTYTTLP